MLNLPEQFLFVVLLIISLYYAAIGFLEVINAIRRGAPTYYPRANHLPARIREAIVRTITQVTVFRDRPVVSFFHSFVFYGFIFYGAVNLWDVVEGYVPASLLAPIHHSLIGGLFRLGADIFGTLVLIGVAYLLYRRFAMDDPKLEQFNPTVMLHPGVKAGGIRRDSIIVGCFILLHVGLRMFGSASLLAAQGHGDTWQPVATLMSHFMGHSPDWMIGWHIGWWGALGLILAFLPYFPRSKHIHLFAAPARFALERRHEDGSRVPLGALEPLDLEDENAEQFGVEKLEQLRFTQLLDPYACIQCNRCTNACPAHTTGKALAPSAIEINKRYELNAIRPAFAARETGSRPVMEFVMSESALWACTACGACVEVCPVGCEQLSDIIDYRRDAVMTKGEFPQQLNNAFRNLERTSNPWGIAAAKREEWKDADTVAPDGGGESRLRGALLGRLRGRLRSLRAEDRAGLRGNHESRQGELRHSRQERGLHRRSGAPRGQRVPLPLARHRQRRDAQCRADRRETGRDESEACRGDVPALLQRLEERLPAARRKLSRSSTTPS